MSRHGADTEPNRTICIQPRASPTQGATQRALTERQRPGELIHVDTKKLGRIDGIGHRIIGDRTGQSRKRGTGRECLHVAIDDASRLAYTEVLADEKKTTACAFMTRALAWFARNGVAAERIMSDNGAAYKSHDFRDLLAQADLRHIRTRLIRHAPTARPSASSRSPCANGSTQLPTPVRPNEPTPCRDGSITTICRHNAHLAMSLR